MSNEDMLEIAERLLRTRSTDALALVQTVEALAAEVRELRKDRERLDALEELIAMRKIVGGPWEGCLPSTRAISAHWLRDLADAAMKERSA